MHLAGKGGQRFIPSVIPCTPAFESELAQSFHLWHSQPVWRRHLSMVFAANPARVSKSMKNKVGCICADRPSGKSSVEPSPGPGTARTLAGSSRWGSKAKYWFLLRLGELRKQFPCSRRFMKVLLYTRDSEHLVHANIERRCCHLCFVGVCHTSCTHSLNRTPTLGVHTLWPSSSVCLEKTDSSPHLMAPSGKALCGATTAEPRPTEGHPALPTPSNSLGRLLLKSCLKRS